MLFDRFGEFQRVILFLKVFYLLQFLILFWLRSLVIERFEFKCKKGKGTTFKNWY